MVRAEDVDDLMYDVLPLVSGEHNIRVVMDKFKEFKKKV